MVDDQRRTGLPERRPRHRPWQASVGRLSFISHSWNGAQLGTSNNGRISTFNVGGIGQVGYGLYQQVGANARDTPTAADYQTIQFTFSEPLSDLSFSITDIDRSWAESGTRDFIDGVSLNSSSAFTSSSPSGSFVIGDGSSTSPWQNQNNGNYSERSTSTSRNQSRPSRSRTATLAVQHPTRTTTKPSS